MGSADGASSSIPAIGCAWSSRRSRPGCTLPGWLCDPAQSAAAVARAAQTAGIEVVPLGIRYRGPPPRAGLLLGFAAVRDRGLRRGVEVLARVLAAATARR